MHNCERCETQISNWNTRAIELYGGVRADLCTRCRTDWDEHFKADPNFDEIMRINARFQFLQGRALGKDVPTEEEWLELEKRKEESKRHYFQVGKAWLAATPVTTEGR